MIYRAFDIRRFRGVSEIAISLEKGDLVLLLGLNESGKTTVLRAIEAFDHRNDPADDSERDSFLVKIRNKSELTSNEPATITARIALDEELRYKDFADVGKPDSSGQTETAELTTDFLDTLNTAAEFRLTRVFPFKRGNPEPPFYRFDTDHAVLKDQAYASALGRRVVELCPFILYFEDFTDRIPEQLLVAKSSDAFNADWYDIIDGLFFNTDKGFSISHFRGLIAEGRTDDTRTVMQRVNMTLNSVFTERWEALSGVKDIKETELIEKIANRRSPCFEIKVTDRDGTTYSVDERSKGALWYLSFLMKTEFRRKKLRQTSGKPIFLIDEPASNLHSTAQTNMLADFRRLVEDTSVIYTTHSQYLISLENVKHTLVMRRDGGLITATRWADYLREEKPEVSHYQPLANLLQIVPNSLDIPWQKAVITEGVSDSHALQLMHRVLYRNPPPYVVYPGTGAFDLRTLISLNLGWQTEFTVLLDGDDAGVQARDNYAKEFQLEDDHFVVLPKGTKLEGLFTKDERKDLFELALGELDQNKVTKTQFRNCLAVLNVRKQDTQVREMLGDETLKRFQRVFEGFAAHTG